MNIKSERLKKLEIELTDLEKWLDLGLVPKKDIEKHKEEICSIKQKIEEEKERLRFMKETGDMQDYVAPKKSPIKQVYPEPQTMPDMDVGAETDADLEETQTFEADTEQEDVTEVATIVEEEEEDPFSDRNRWKRGILEDPDADNW
ncbi:MAG: hypothetical protein K940chlam1_00638 [Candidatus Anoxychlamydiales bacterium]|nr:hypothetical protein [Candidatus Anoxychlamydiales bacterium]NGX36041.1 hypothetical protein [Candidatus Anoxychlamydiales bacterium]